MADRTVYHVMTYGAKISPDGNIVSNDGWKVKRENADKAAKRFPSGEYNKMDAVKYGKQLCENNIPSKIIIHKKPIMGKNGTMLHPISRSHSYDKNY